MSMENEGLVRWGEIYLCDLGTSESSVQSGIRPVLVVQNNVGNIFSPTTVIAPITKTVKRLHLPSHVMLDPSCGLPSPSVVMLEQVRTVDKKELIKYMGKLRDEFTITDVKAAISAEFGLTEVPFPYKTHLCSKCLTTLLKDSGITIYQKSQARKSKEQCDICGRGSGFAYSIRRKGPWKYG